MQSSANGSEFSVYFPPFPVLTPSQGFQSIAFVVCMFVLREIPMTPFAIYKNFVLEEKHGFNKMTAAT